jgi:phosphatidylglycerophosphatase A
MSKTLPVKTHAVTRVAILTGSSWFGAGYLPKMPGTWGALGAIPLWWWLTTLFPEPIWFGAAVLVFCALAVLVCIGADRIYETHDSQKIVIDEVAGVLVAAIGAPFRWQQVVVVFALFRLFDIWKPGPVKWADKKVSGGVGVWLDDIIAGLMACAVVHLVRYLYGGWW